MGELAIKTVIPSINGMKAPYAYIASTGEITYNKAKHEFSLYGSSSRKLTLYNTLSIAEPSGKLKASDPIDITYNNYNNMIGKYNVTTGNIITLIDHIEIVSSDENPIHVYSKLCSITKTRTGIVLSNNNPGYTSEVYIDGEYRINV